MQRAQGEKELKECIVFLFVLFFSFNLLAIFFCGILREIDMQIPVGVPPAMVKNKRPQLLRP